MTMYSPVTKSMALTHQQIPLSDQKGGFVNINLLHWKS